MGEAIPKVKTSVEDHGWTGLSLTQMAIGYEVTQTPLQTLALYNAVANNGRMMRPQLVRSLQRGSDVVKTYEPFVLNTRLCNAVTLAACQDMMEAVCDPEGEGTAQKLFADKPYTVAGKTGTARIATRNGYEQGRYRASFAGYFPADNPRYSCIVVIADTKSGSYYGSTIAAPVFREVADLIYATDPAFHTLSRGPLAETQSLPASKDGDRKALTTLYAALGMPHSEGLATDWVQVETGDDEAQLHALDLQESEVPDVRGMGLRDALYLLENAGLKVDYQGMGTVKSQSIAPGTPFETNSPPSNSDSRETALRFALRRTHPRGAWHDACRCRTHCSGLQKSPTSGTVCCHPWNRGGWAPIHRTSHRVRSRMHRLRAHA